MNKKENYLIFKAGEKEFRVDRDRLFFIASRLVNHDITNEEELHDVMERFKLYDEYFLSNVNRI